MSTITEIEKKARTLKNLQTMKTNLEEQIEELENELKAELEEQGVEEVQAGLFKIIWKKITSTRFDSKRFKEENERIYQLYMVPNTYRRFSIS